MRKLSLAASATLAGLLTVVGEAAAQVPETPPAPTAPKKAEAPKKTEAPKPPSLKIETKDGKSSLEAGLTAQLRVEMLNTDKGPGKDDEQDATIFFRRIRPVLKGSLLTKDFTYQLQLNLVPGAIELIDLYAGYEFCPDVQLTVGQAKIPFTRYRLGSYKDLSLTEWSNETKFFGAERQLGILLHNGFGKPPPLEYQIGVYTGVNARGSNAIGMSKVFAEDPPNPSDLTDPAPPAELHPEIAGHIGYGYGGINTRVPADFEGGPARFMVGASAAWDARPTPQQDMALRLAPEAMLKAYGFTLNGVFYLGFWEKEDKDLASIAHGFTGVMVQAGQAFLERFDIAFRYTLVHLAEALREQARAHADARIAEAEDEDAQKELTTQYKNVGKVTDEHDFTVGFDMLLLGTTLKWQTDASALWHARTDDDRIDYRVRSQLQVSF